MAEILIGTKLLFYFVVLAAWGTVDLLSKIVKFFHRIIDDAYSEDSE